MNNYLYIKILLERFCATGDRAKREAGGKVDSSEVDWAKAREQ